MVRAVTDEALLAGRMPVFVVCLLLVGLGINALSGDILSKIDLPARLLLLGASVAGAGMLSFAVIKFTISIVRPLRGFLILGGVSVLFAAPAAFLPSLRTLRPVETFGLVLASTTSVVIGSLLASTVIVVGFVQGYRKGYRDSSGDSIAVRELLRVHEWLRDPIPLATAAHFEAVCDLLERAARAFERTLELPLKSDRDVRTVGLRRLQIQAYGRGMRDLKIRLLQADAAGVTEVADQSFKAALAIACGRYGELPEVPPEPLPRRVLWTRLWSIASVVVRAIIPLAAVLGWKASGVLFDEQRFSTLLVCAFILGVIYFLLALDPEAEKRVQSAAGVWKALGGRGGGEE